MRYELVILANYQTNENPIWSWTTWETFESELTANKKGRDMVNESIYVSDFKIEVKNE